jgi:hypothetical protein
MNCSENRLWLFYLYLDCCTHEEGFAEAGSGRTRICGKVEVKGE